MPIKLRCRNILVVLHHLDYALRPCLLGSTRCCNTCLQKPVCLKTFAHLDLFLWKAVLLTMQEEKAKGSCLSLHVSGQGASPSGEAGASSAGPSCGSGPSLLDTHSTAEQAVASRMASLSLNRVRTIAPPNQVVHQVLL